MLSDVPKTMVYALAELINIERELIPRASVEKPPSAELRPNQKDQILPPPMSWMDLRRPTSKRAESRGNRLRV